MARKATVRRRGGWRRNGDRIQAYVRLHAGAGGLRTRPYPLGTLSSEMQTWIDDTVTEYRRRHPRGVVGTLARDVVEYLKLLVHKPRLQAERRRQLAWWCERFGHRSRWSLTPLELETALNALLAAGASASHVKHHRTALYHLFTKMDGKNAPNPLRDVPPPREPDPLPRAMPYELIDQIFAAMPDQRYAKKLTIEQAAAVRAEARKADANNSAIARAFNISETMVRKLATRREIRHDARAKTKARLGLVAYVGLPPALIKQIGRPDIDLEGASVLVHGRKKGGGTRPTRLPLTPRGVEAFRAFIAADACGPFSTSSAQKLFLRAIAALCTRLGRDAATRQVGQALRAQLGAMRATEYDLRHSFLTAAQIATGNIHATQGLALHSDIRMTLRYTLGAVAPELTAAAALLATWPAGRSVSEASDESNE